MSKYRLSKSLRQLPLLFIAVLLGMFLQTGIQYVMAHGGDSSLIHGCVKTGLLGNGGLRIVGANTNCNSNETALDWQQKPEEGTVFPFICHNCDLSYVGNRLTGRDLTNAHLRFAVMTNLNLSQTNFTNADLKAANFTGSNLSGAKLNNVDATEIPETEITKFDDTNLVNASLTNGDFSKASFIGANMTGATTSGADFTDAVWSNTTCPDGTNSDAHSNTCIGHL